MSDLRVSFRAFRGLLAAVLLASFGGVLMGCTGEPTPAPSDAGASSAPAAAPTGDAKKPEAKQAGKADKGNLMPEFPKG